MSGCKDYGQAVRHDKVVLGGSLSESVEEIWHIARETFEASSRQVCSISVECAAEEDGVDEGLDAGLGVREAEPDCAH